VARRIPVGCTDRARDRPEEYLRPVPPVGNAMLRVSYQLNLTIPAPVMDEYWAMGCALLLVLHLPLFLPLE
jgi:hypothetical protein